MHAYFLYNQDRSFFKRVYAIASSSSCCLGDHLTGFGSPFESVGKNSFATLVKRCTACFRCASCVLTTCAKRSQLFATHFCRRASSFRSIKAEKVCGFTTVSVFVFYIFASNRSVWDITTFASWSLQSASKCDFHLCCWKESVL
eukprot:SAG11_NODE_54_length_19571_cov_29.437786_11_plen_144_part_00